jgi:hypothetical protein
VSIFTKLYTLVYSMSMKKIFKKKLILGLFVFSSFLINTNSASAKVATSNNYNNVNNYTQSVSQNVYVVSGPELNNLPLCDSTYKLNCPYNVRCRNINGMIAFACPAAFANQPLNTNYTNSYSNNYGNNYNSNNNSNYDNTFINYDYNSNSNYKFVNSPVYFENGAYYTNPVQNPYYDITPTYNQASNFYYSY